MSSRRRVSKRGQGAMSGETEVKSEAQMALKEVLKKRVMK